MRWLNIEIATLRSPAFVGAEPVERATWLSLLAYCADQENGGVIKRCRDWKDRQWQQTCGITLLEAQLEAELWTWSGDDLRVAYYPKTKEEEIKAKRQAGASGGRASGQARREAQLEAQLQPELEAHLERKGKERNRKEGNTLNYKQETQPEFPANLDTLSFRSLWMAYLEYRKASRMKNLLPTSVQAQLKKLSDWGHDAALESIQQTISNGWQGLFPPKSNKNYDISNSRTAKRDREIDGQRAISIRTI